MKNKSYLSLLEQLFMILIFALASALCLRGFYLANKMSKDREVLDNGVFSAQNAAELLKSTKGDLESCATSLGGFAEKDALTVFFDSNGHAVNSEKHSRYKLVATKNHSSDNFTESASICVICDSKIIFELEVAWQIGGSYEE